MSEFPDDFKFVDELAAATTTASYLERNSDQKSRVYMVDLLEHANRHTVSLPDYVADHFKKCFDNGEITIKDANDVIDKLSEYSKNRGYSWQHDVAKHVYCSDTDQLKAYITVSNDAVTPLYTAICSDNGKETELCRSNEYTDCEKKIGERFYNTALSDLSKNGNVPHIIKDLTTLADNYRKDKKMEKLLDTYKNHKIVDNDGVIEVVSDENTRFIIGLDDSKNSGRRIFNEDFNNVKAAKDYIDLKSNFTAAKEQKRADVENLVKYAESIRLSVPVKTQERWHELLKNGESEVTIKKYIDEYSKAIKAPAKEAAQENIVEKKDIGMDI